ncbi:hypothetical protein HYH03_003347 [Edaphochlamys debaryana]|uniref:Uncharacterized protein n=1 Tax=Edaphochlamys debaryana TaxID=47281 RepID=A0A836C306_9CHLO|nr:hypothetical protein HYH03_003347 [Edaphochlamys debaryana]|eukprot:KAG2498596.1 hypothetical protein HYH03_003347 [Edaphochlamys debaryana]
MLHTLAGGRWPPGSLTALLDEEPEAFETVQQGTKVYARLVCPTLLALAAGVPTAWLPKPPALQPHPAPASPPLPQHGPAIAPRPPAAPAAAKAKAVWKAVLRRFAPTRRREAVDRNAEVSARSVKCVTAQILAQAPGHEMSLTHLCLATPRRTWRKVDPSVLALKAVCEQEPDVFQLRQRRRAGWLGWLRPATWTVRLVWTELAALGKAAAAARAPCSHPPADYND